MADFPGGRFGGGGGTAPIVELTADEDETLAPAGAMIADRTGDVLFAARLRLWVTAAAARTGLLASRAR